MDSLSKAVSSSQSWPKNLVLTSACLLSEAVYIPHYTKKSKRKEGGGGISIIQHDFVVEPNKVDQKVQPIYA